MQCLTGRWSTVWCIYVWVRPRVCARGILTVHKLHTPKHYVSLGDFGHRFFLIIRSIYPVQEQYWILLECSANLAKYASSRDMMCSYMLFAEEQESQYHTHQTAWLVHAPSRPDQFPHHPSEALKDRTQADLPVSHIALSIIKNKLRSLSGKFSYVT